MAAFLSVVSLGLTTTTVATIDCLRAIGRRVRLRRKSRKERQRAALIERFELQSKQSNSAASTTDVSSIDSATTSSNTVVGRRPKPIARQPIANPHDICTICLEELGTDGPVSYLQCTHLYHTSCMLEHVSRSKTFLCPLCRAPIAAAVPDWAKRPYPQLPAVPEEDEADDSGGDSSNESSSSGK